MLTVEQMHAVDVAVVGGGLAGLTAATILARAGRTVTLYEKAAALGGRARTTEQQGYALNMGPHALYRGGVAAPILRALGVQWQGFTPPQDGFGFAAGRLQTLPAGPRTLLTSRLLTAGAKREFVTLLPRIFRADLQQLQRVSLQDWLAQTVRHHDLQQLLLMLVRVSTYSADSARLSAGAALSQVRLALLQNVDYIEGGWQVLVDQLAAAARQAGVQIQTDQRIVGVVQHPDGSVCGVRVADGAVQAVSAVVLATDPKTAAVLTSNTAAHTIATWANEAIPVLMTCLTVGLERLPVPTARLAFGIDQPLYLSVHAPAPRSAPDQPAVIHLGKYLTAPPTNPEEIRQELAGLLDLIQPGWRQLAVVQQFLPQMTVSPALVTAATGGYVGRPGPAVPDLPGLYVAGDWVGPTGMLADAAVSSAKLAAEQILTAIPQQLLVSA